MSNFDNLQIALIGWERKKNGDLIFLQDLGNQTNRDTKEKEKYKQKTLNKRTWQARIRN